MGFPIETVPAARTSICETADGSLWNWKGDSSARRLEIVEFKAFSPKATGGVDLVGSGETKPSGKEDFVVQFTVKSTESDIQPPKWLLWLTAVAEMRIGENDAAGDWKARFDVKNVPPIFSFRYGGVSSDEFLKSWQLSSLKSIRPTEKNPLFLFKTKGRYWQKRTPPYWRRFRWFPSKMPPLVSKSPTWLLKN